MQVFHYTCFAMGTRFNVVIPGLENKHGEIIGKEISGILNEQELIMSCYRNDSEVSAINRLAFKQNAKVSDELYEILKTCDYYYNKTLGAFDPALLNITLKAKNQQDTTLAFTDNQLKEQGWSQVILEKNSSTVRFNNEGVGIDLGGFGKGWAMEKIISHLEGKGIEKAFISFGESTVSAMGQHPLGGPWQTSIPHIKNRKNLDLQLKDESFSVSGLKEKAGETDTENSSHIFSPGQKSMIKENFRVLIKSNSAIQSEILSTAIIASNDKQKKHILDAFPEAKVYECRNNGWLEK